MEKQFLQWLRIYCQSENMKEKSNDMGFGLAMLIFGTGISVVMIILFMKSGYKILFGTESTVRYGSGFPFILALILSLAMSWYGIRKVIFRKNAD